MVADEIRRAIEAASRITLPQVTALLWRAYGDGKVTEAEAEALSGLIEARRESRIGASRLTFPEPELKAETPAGSSRRSAGSRPRTAASLERRRRWAASGRLPPGLAARFTLAEQAVLALVAAETARRGDCRLAVGQLAAIVGVAETTVRNALREARKLGLVTVEERRLTGFRNDTNVVRIISPEWQAWLRLARKADSRNFVEGAGLREGSSAGRGCKSAQRTPTQVLDSEKARPTASSEGCRKAAVDLAGSGATRIRASGGTGRAMR